MTLELHEVCITLGARVLVPPLSVSVAAGEVLVVMGESGSGKSSLLAWLAGLLEPPLQGSGAVVLAGRDITAAPVEQRHVGLIFQDDLLFPHLSVLDNLLFALPAGPRAGRLARAGDALAQAELSGLGARRPAQLSGGQRSRVSLLRALIAQPAALLLDEPFSRLDASLRQRMRDFTWRALRQRGIPAVLVTHDAADIPALAQVVQLPARLPAPSSAAADDV